MEEIKLCKQEQRVFDYMLEHGGITVLEAFTEIGVTRLSARLVGLKKKGVNIRKERLRVKNRYGETCSVCRYSIA